MLVASPRFEPEPCRIAICVVKPKRGTPATARLGATRWRSPAKAQRPPAGGGTDRPHGWQGTDPLCWRYAEREIVV